MEQCTHEVHPEYRKVTTKPADQRLASHFERIH